MLVPNTSISVFFKLIRRPPKVLSARSICTQRTMMSNPVDITSPVGGRQSGLIKNK